MDGPHRVWLWVFGWRVRDRAGEGDTPIEQVDLSSGTIQYLVADALGSVRGVVDSSGTLSGTTAYDAWGNPGTSGGLTASTPLGYAGSYTDTTGLSYLIHRYYDPQTGQFLSLDPQFDSTDLPYAYTAGDPVQSTDRSGLCSGPSNGTFMPVPGFGLGVGVGAGTSKTASKPPRLAHADDHRIRFLEHDIIAGDLSAPPQIAPTARFRATAFGKVEAEGAEEIAAQITVLDSGELGYPVSYYPGGGPITVDVSAFRASAPADPWITSMLTGYAWFDGEMVSNSQVIEVNYLTGQTRLPKVPKLPPV